MEKNCYNDEELEEFRQLILKKLAEAREDIRILLDAIGTQNPNDTRDTSPTFKVLEEGRSVLSKEENALLYDRKAKHIHSLENALIRIQNKTYGICRVTKKLIPKERLRAVPHATLSIEGKSSSKKDTIMIYIPSIE